MRSDFFFSFGCSICVAPIVTQPVTENRNYLFYQLQQLRAIHKQDKHGEFPPDGAPVGLGMRRTLRRIDWPIRMIDPRSVGNVYIQTSTAGDVIGVSAVYRAGGWEVGDVRKESWGDVLPEFHQLPTSVNCCIEELL